MLEFDFTARTGAFQLQVQGRQETPRVGLFGPSGSGKTTLLNCLTGLLRPESGVILLDGEPLFDASARICIPPHRRSVGCVFQDGRLFPHMSVRANIEYGRPRKGRQSDMAELVRALDLEGLLDRFPNTLSAGERQRVALARALAARPRLLLLDEPLSSLDGDSRLRILPYLNRVYNRLQVPFIYVSHSLSEILFLAEFSWQMSGGRIVRRGRPHQLLAGLAHHVDPIQNLLSGTVESVPARTGYALVACGGCRLKVPNTGLRVGDQVTLALPARDLMLSVSPPQGLSARNTLVGRVQHLEQDGHALWAVAEAGANRLIVELTEEAGRDLGLHAGMQVYMVFKSHSVTVSPADRRRNHQGAGGRDISRVNSGKEATHAR